MGEMTAADWRETITSTFNMIPGDWEVILLNLRHAPIESPDPRRRLSTALAVLESYNVVSTIGEGVYELTPLGRAVADMHACVERGVKRCQRWEVTRD